MEWIVLAVIVVGFFIVQAINKLGRDKQNLQVPETDKKRELANRKYWELRRPLMEAKLRVLEEDIKTLKNEKLTKKQKLSFIDKNNKEIEEIENKNDKEMEDFEIKLGVGRGFSTEEMDDFFKPYKEMSAPLFKEKQELLHKLKNDATYHVL